MSYQIIKEKNGVIRAPARSTAVKNKLDFSARNGKFKRLEPHFQLSATKVRLERGHGNRCRLATLTEVHQGVHICLVKLWFEGKSSELEQNYGMSYRKKLRGKKMICGQ